MTKTFTPHATIEKFGFPESLVCEYDKWVVLLRPKQATLGALVMACKEEVTAFSEISSEAFREQEKVVRDIEASLKAFSPYDKINYLMLMMLDREVHYHVLPRYAEAQEFDSNRYEDKGWPGIPDLTAGPELEGKALRELASAIRAHWPSA